MNEWILVSSTFNTDLRSNYSKTLLELIFEYSATKCLTSVFSQRRINCSAAFQGEASGSVNHEGKGKFGRDFTVLARYPWINRINQVPTNSKIPKFFAARTWLWLLQVDFQDC